jgi:FecR protein
MALDGPLDIEALSESRWGRIERALFRKLDAEVEAPNRGKRMSGVWGRAAALIAASAAAAAVGGILATELVRRAPVAEAPSHIETHAMASHVVVGEASLDVAPESELVVAGNDERGVLVVLAHGRVDCDVAARNGRPPFIVQAGDVRVRVVGTRFAVSRASDDVHVDVAKGVVEIQSHGDVQNLTAGQRWPFEVAAGEPAHAPVPVPIVASSPAPAPLAVADATPPSRGVVSKARGARGSGSRRALRTAPPATSPPAPDPVPAAEPSAEPQPGAPAPAASARQPRQARYELAESVEASDPDRALAIYLDLAHGSDEWSAMALYAAGRLEGEYGHDASARGLLEQYLARHAHGPNAVDARNELLMLAQRSSSP